MPGVQTSLAQFRQRAITDHLRYSIGRPAAALRPEHYYRALALAVRDRMQDRRVASTQTSLDLGRKVTCYLSAEFLTTCATTTPSWSARTTRRT